MEAWKVGRSGGWKIGKPRLPRIQLENQGSGNQGSGNQESGNRVCRAIDEARAGGVIQVNFAIIAPNDSHCVVEDAFRAGAEGLDQSLKMTSVVGEVPD